MTNAQDYAVNIKFMVQQQGAKETTDNLKKVSKAQQQINDEVDNMIRSGRARDVFFASDKAFAEFMTNHAGEMNNMMQKFTANVRKASRGLQGFRMDFLNILFIGMQLQAIFGGFGKRSSIMGVFDELIGVLSELTVGQSPLAFLMVELLVKFIEFLAENPGVAKTLGNLAVILSVLGTIMFNFAMVGMAVGSLFGKEGTVKILKDIATLLGVGGGAAAATTGKGIMGVINKLTKLGANALTFTIAFGVIADWWSDENATGLDTTAALLSALGLGATFFKNARFKQAGGFGMLLGLAFSIFSSTDEGIEVSDAIWNAISVGWLAGYIAKAAGAAKFARFGGVAAVITLGIQFIIDENFRNNFNNLLNQVLGSVYDAWKSALNISQDIWNATWGRITGHKLDADWSNYENPYTGNMHRDANVQFQNSFTFQNNTYNTGGSSTHNNPSSAFLKYSFIN